MSTNPNRLALRNALALESCDSRRESLTASLPGTLACVATFAGAGKIVFSATRSGFDALDASVRALLM